MCILYANLYCYVVTGSFTESHHKKSPNILTVTKYFFCNNALPHHSFCHCVTSNTDFTVRFFFEKSKVGEHRRPQGGQNGCVLPLEIATKNHKHLENLKSAA